MHNALLLYRSSKQRKERYIMNKSLLIEQCQMGNSESFSQLYKLYSRQAMGTAYLIAGNSGLAEDIVQEAFVQCFTSIGTLKNVETFDVWFYKILVRAGWRISKKYKGTVNIAEINNEIALADFNAIEELNSCENRLVIYEALSKLSLPLRTVVVLHYFNDISIKDISKMLGCFEGTVKSRLHNAKKQLREVLNKDDSFNMVNVNYLYEGCSNNGK
jgi:RNA polymerase sigma-70 factor (ECF subfamily)